MKIAIVYSTKYNTVTTCVEKLKAELKHHNVTTFSLKDTKDILLSEFDAVILGGSIYVSKTQKGLVDFCKTREVELKQKKLGIFLCSAFAAPEEFSMNFPESLRKHCLETQNFGYEMHFQDYTFMEKTIVKMIPAKNRRPEGIMDVRIREFVSKIVS